MRVGNAATDVVQASFSTCKRRHSGRHYRRCSDAISGTLQMRFKRGSGVVFPSFHFGAANDAV